MMITRDMIIGEILGLRPDASEILLNSGMHCIGCPSSQGESLEEACLVHGMNVDEVVADINTYLASK